MINMEVNIKYDLSVTMGHEYGQDIDPYSHEVKASFRSQLRLQ